MRAKVSVYFFVIAAVACLAGSALQAQTNPLTAPEEHFGFRPGSDRQLFHYDELIDYLKSLDNASDRLQLQEIGATPMGLTMYCAFVSTAANLSNLTKLKAINQRLALDANLSDYERNSFIEYGKVFAMVTLSMHSTELGPTQAIPIFLYEILSSDDPQILAALENVVLMIVPCHNPDGMDMVVDHYQKYLGSKYEGCGMPGLYHKYVGHDNNRDFITLSQEDTRVISRLFSTEWFPQVVLEKHQMGYGSARYFVPPSHDPIAENVAAELWNWTWILGSNIMTDMTQAGLSGISQHYLFDDYWPGSTTTCIWKNVIGLLTECASVQGATPVYIEPSELSGYGKGLSEYKKSINMPKPWPGGWWRLADIVEYERVSMYSFLKTLSLYHKDILQFRNDICIQQVKLGQTEAPIYYVLPREQHDASEFVHLVNLLTDHGIRVFKLTAPYRMAGTEYQRGDIVIPLAQPYRAFIKEVMEKQEFPVRHYTPGGEIIEPYDITSWSLPLHRGVTCRAVDIRSGEFENLLEPIPEEYHLRGKLPAKFNAALFSINNNESYKAAFMAMKSGLDVYRLEESLMINQQTIPKGSFVVYAERRKSQKFESLFENLAVAPLFVSEKTEMKKSILAVPKIGLIESYFHDMDAGWTRYILDEYSLPYRVIRPAEIGITNLKKELDLIIFPNENADVLMEGKYKSNDQYYVSSYPPEYTKPIGKEGLSNLLSFVNEGGTIISWGRSTQLFGGLLQIKSGKDIQEEFRLPFNDITVPLTQKGFSCPGAYLKAKFTSNHPITYGLPEKAGLFYHRGRIFTTHVPVFDMDRRIIAKYPHKDILLSGYCQAEESLADKVAIVWIKKGGGQLVLFGCNPQFRASTQGSYKLLFNSILLAK